MEGRSPCAVGTLLSCLTLCLLAWKPTASSRRLVPIASFEARFSAAQKQWLHTCGVQKVRWFFFPQDFEASSWSVQDWPDLTTDATNVNHAIMISRYTLWHDWCSPNSSDIAAEMFRFHFPSRKVADPVVDSSCSKLFLRFSDCGLHLHSSNQQQAFLNGQEHNVRPIPINFA